MLERPPDHVLQVDDADDVVRVLADDGDPGEARAEAERQRLPQGLVALDEDHLRARHHHLLREGVPELEDGVDHLALVILDEVVGLGQVDHLAKLGLRGEGALAVALARGDRVADEDEQRRQRAEDGGEEGGRPGGGHGDPLSVLASERARRYADDDVRGDDHDHHREQQRECRARAARGNQGIDAYVADEHGRGDGRHRRQEQQHVHMPRPVLQHPQQAVRSLVPVLARIVDLGAADPADRRLGHRQQSGEPHQHDGGQHEPRVGAHAPLHPSSSASWRLNMASYSSCVAWS